MADINMTRKVDDSGCVQIPYRILKDLDIKVGDYLLASELDGAVLFKPIKKKVVLKDIIEKAESRSLSLGWCPASEELVSLLKEAKEILKSESEEC